MILWQFFSIFLNTWHPQPFIIFIFRSFITCWFSVSSVSLQLKWFRMLMKSWQRFYDKKVYLILKVFKWNYEKNFHTVACNWFTKRVIYIETNFMRWVFFFEKMEIGGDQIFFAFFHQLALFVKDEMKNFVFKLILWFIKSDNISQIYLRKTRPRQLKESSEWNHRLQRHQSHKKLRNKFK